jgi:LysR family transcriptional regulator for metE and metH
VDASSTPHPVSALLDGRIDLAVVSDRLHDSRVATQPLFEDDLVVVTAPTHRLAARRFLVAEDFASETLIIYPPRDESTVLRRVLIPAGVMPAAIQQIAVTEAIIELVKADLGIAVMARWAVRPYVEAGKLSAIRLTRKGFRRQWVAVVLKGMATVSYVKDFIALVAQRAPTRESRDRHPSVLQFESPTRVTTPRNRR